MNNPLSRRDCLLLAVAAGMAWSGPALALDAPKNKVVLTVSGQIAHTNQGASAVFDMPMLEALPQHRFTTLTPWEKQPITFSGPRLRDVLKAVGAKGQSIRATAINDYRITIPVADAQTYDVLIATRMNGEPMPVRSRGPLFIIYPFDSEPALQSTTYYERSIWQLKAIDIE